MTSNRVHSNIGIAVFAKAPVAGKVKTRLAATLGLEGAAILHSRLVEHTLKLLHSIAAVHIELWCAPDPADPFFETLRLRYGIGLHAQTHGDLGSRMAHAAADVLQRSPAVILIGTDCPLLAADQIEAMRAALHAGIDAVVLPAEDGGYLALGLRRVDRTLFENIDWGSAQVCAQTMARLDRLRWNWSRLDPVWDLDRPSDWERLRREAPALARRLFPEAPDVL